MSKSMHFWEKSVGVVVSPSVAVDGTSYWTFSFVRARRSEGGYCIDYNCRFKRNNIEALGKVMSKVVDFIDREKAESYVDKAGLSEAA